MSMDEKLLNKQIKGLLIGTAVGDAIGLPREGLSANRAKKLFGSKLQHSLIVTPWGRIGLCSDDTEHAVMVGQCLLELNENRDNFLKLLARHMRCWFLTLPFGIGMATLKACFKLCLGINPHKTGVKSAGNGAVMRAPIIGWFFADNMQMMKKTLQESTYITHSDSRAFEGAWTIAMAARYATNHQPQIAPVDAFFSELLPTLKGEELINSLRVAQSKLLENATLSEYLILLNLPKNGITGYVNYTVPATIYAWLRYYGDYEKTISELVIAGGDTDTNAAVAGALAGLVIGCDKTPTCWIKGISDWPMSIKYMNRLSGLLVNKKLYPNKKLKNRPLNLLFLLGRNIIFLAVILMHGVRRLFPPY